VQFNSIEFLIFFAVTYLLYRVLPFRWQNGMLLVASYIFYGWLDVRLVGLIVVATAISYYCGLGIDAGEDASSKPSYARYLFLKPDRRRALFLWLGIGGNLAILGFFKYFNFFVDSVAALTRSLGIRFEVLHLNILLIAGVSFYTFKAISYLADVYQRKIAATPNIVNFALYLAFFPSLLAGPIDRAGKLIPQLDKPRTINFDQSAEGTFLILLGLFKKVAIADGLAPTVNGVYGAAGAPTWIDVFLATVLYTIQIYCDFSGYSDIAIGLAKLLGIDLMQNFNLPYFSKNPSEFWRRWHISLSTWLRDYLYIPLGGNRRGNLATYRNLMVTMVLGGLWHGPDWNFVLWGFYQGATLCVYRALGIRETRAEPAQVGNLFLAVGAGIVFFFITCYGWLLFRSTSLEQVLNFTHILFTDFGNFKLTMPKLELSASWGMPLLIVYEILAYVSSRPGFKYRFPMPLCAAFYAMLIFVLLMGLSNEPAQYIYTQF
jgi:D-alanyl-lipoteichoic acid acyltransferase DltB (MBOAT superfamily)